MKSFANGLLVVAISTNAILLENQSQQDPKDIMVDVQMTLKDYLALQHDHEDLDFEILESDEEEKLVEEMEIVEDEDDVEEEEEDCEIPFELDASEFELIMEARRLTEAYRIAEAERIAEEERVAEAMRA